MRLLTITSPFSAAPFVFACAVLMYPSVSIVAERRSDSVNDRYLLMNIAASEYQNDTMREIRELAASWSAGQPRIGVGGIVSYFRQSPEKTLKQLRRLLSLCEEHELAVIVQLDGEQWWMARPDLWNWWDKDRPGYNPANADNVEWFGWGRENALKIAWRNWGKQLRVAPPPNLMSPRYREACHTAMEPLVKEVVRWRDSLPGDKRWMLVGVKVGWESTIGMGSHYYPNGNSLVDKDPSNDPDQRAKPAILPGRGYQPIGYAAVSAAGLAHEGDLKEEHLAEVVQRHLDDLASVARRAGLPREQIFTHCGGWAEGEKLYQSAVNENSCPGWSFYRYGRDPLGDKTAMAALATSNAPYWAVTEWLPIGARTADDWEKAIRSALSIDRCRYICAFNWRKIQSDSVAREGIRRALAQPLPTNSRIPPSK